MFIMYRKRVKKKKYFCRSLEFLWLSNISTDRQVYQENISSWLQRHKQNMKHSKENTLEVPLIYRSYMPPQHICKERERTPLILQEVLHRVAIWTGYMTTYIHKTNLETTEVRSLCLGLMFTVRVPHNLWDIKNNQKLT